MQIPLISSMFGAKGLSGGRLAVALGAHGVFLAEVKFGGAMPQVTRCEYHDTGAVSAAALERLCRDAGVGGHHCTTLLMPGEYQLIMVEAPNVPDGELKTAVRWKIKDSLSYQADNATLDVLRIPADRSNAGRAQSLYAVAASSDIIEKRMALFAEAKLKLDVIDIPEMAQRNIAALFEQEGRALALLAFDDDGGLLTFTAGGELYMARRLEINAGQLRDADEDLRRQARDRVELELQRSLDYFDRQFNYLPVGRILVSAPEEALLVEFLVSVIGDKVERLELAQALDIEALPALAGSEFAAFALPVLGAALRREEGGR